jgi:hypothetical protein
MKMKLVCTKMMVAISYRRNVFTRMYHSLKSIKLPFVLGKQASCMRSCLVPLTVNYVMYVCTVTGWERVQWDQDSLIRVTTDKGGVFYSRKLVLSVGAWAPEMYGHKIPSTPLHVERRVLYWFEPATGTQADFAVGNL